MTNTPIPIERGPLTIPIEFKNNPIFGDMYEIDWLPAHICHVDEHDVCVECQQIALERIIRMMENKPAKQLSPLGEMFADELTV